jgi:V/A-type H+/Na+-transporting ATPase subunit I
MIVAMKKVSIICQNKDAAETVNSLRSLGVVHVEHQQVPQGSDIAALQEDIGLADAALGILSRYAPEHVEAVHAQKHHADWKVSSRHIVDLEKRLDQLREYSRALKVKISEWEQWGDGDPEKIESLSHRNIFIRFYQIPEKEIEALPVELIVRVISARGGIVNCAVISRQKKDLPYKEVLPPKVSLSAMRHKLEQDSTLETALTHDLVKHNAHRGIIQENKAMLEKELMFHQAIRGMGQQGMLAYLTGYAPFDSIDMLEMAARDHQWALSVIDPGAEDAVPTLLRNPQWVDRIKPIFSLLGISPGYHELDVSIVFLVFFSIFFGILIGDAGYGIVYMALTGLLHYKMKNNLAMKHVFPLLYLLSSCAIVWGILTGTFFGQAWLQNKGFVALVPQLNDSKIMQTFCFFLGAFHLSIAHSWRAILKLPSLSALADVGWICVLWVAFFMARTLILAEVFPAWGASLAYTGIGLVVLFTNPQRNMFKAIGEGLGTIALSLMNNFTDVVSYVRLYAVGLAGVAIAETTNSMAAGLGDGVTAAVAKALLVVASAFIVLIGHSLNIVLGPMSVLVHGVRLNVLEFSGHASVSWSGFAYEPLHE